MAVGLMALGGCESTQQPRRSGTTHTVTAYPPSALHVHPLSHVIRRDDGTVAIEVYVQLQDADGVPTRGKGTLELGFHQADRFGGAILVRRTWTVDLTGLEANRSAFDDSLRAYRIERDLGPESLPRFPSVTASWHFEDGTVLEHSGDVRVIEPRPEDDQRPEGAIAG